MRSSRLKLPWCLHDSEYFSENDSATQKTSKIQQKVFLLAVRAQWWLFFQLHAVPVTWLRPGCTLSCFFAYPLS